MAHSWIGWVVVGVGVLAGFGLGLATEWLLGPGYRNHKAIGNHANRNHTRGERELFTTTTPDRYPPGRAITVQEGRHVVTQVYDLGGFPDINGDWHGQWRVYGRPA